MHSVHDSFSPLLSLTLRGKQAIAALGPIYDSDPAADLLRPFHRSAAETGWNVGQETLSPEQVVGRVRRLRQSAIPAASVVFDEDPGRVELVEWTRAGLVLEVCRANGINYSGRGLIRVPWRLRGTVTGRFGTEPVHGQLNGKEWTFNPLSLGPIDRVAIVPRVSGNRIAVLDFKAMDLCSMVSLVPGLRDRYGRHDDLHSVTAVIMCGLDPPPEARDLIKEQIFVHAYGGNSPLRADFERFVPELDWLRRRPHGEGARLVQSQSSRAFRAALSKALPLLLGQSTMPMFTVHDELALEYSESHSNLLAGVAKALEEGATQRIGVPYRVGVSTGVTYEEAKHA